MIEIFKGDTKSITIILKSNGVAVPFVTGDTITLTAKKNTSQITKDIEKIVTTFTNGQAIINLTTTDTDINTGTYLYDIQYDKENGERHTIIKDKIIIKAQIT